jgi:hypothetical protein
VAHYGKIFYTTAMLIIRLDIEMNYLGVPLIASRYSKE